MLCMISYVIFHAFIVTTLIVRCWATMPTMIPVLMHVLTTTRHSILVFLNMCQVTQLLTLCRKFIIIFYYKTQRQTNVPYSTYCAAPWQVNYLYGTTECIGLLVLKCDNTNNVERIVGTNQLFLSAVRSSSLNILISIVTCFHLWFTFILIV